MINILIVNNIKLMQQELNASIKLHFTLFVKKGGGVISNIRSEKLVR